MKFKKLFLFAMILPLLGLFSSCHNTREDEIAQLPYVNFENDTTELSFVKAGETKTINLESSRAWKVMNIPEWVSVSPESGKGNQKLTIITSPNSGVKRQSKIAVNITQATGYLVNLNIVQDGEGGAEPGGGDALYFEDFGAKVEKVDNKWPFADKYTGWSRKGSLTQADVVYAGKGSSVRSSGPKYAPAGENPGGAPYGYWSKSADYFQIEKINVAGNSNLILQFYAQHQSAYSGSPVFSPITAATLKVYAGFDGENWAELPISSDGVEGWNFVKSEFKIPEGQATIYLKFSDFVGEKDNQFRIDDIAILAGGAGELINPGGGTTPPSPPNDDVDALYFEGFGTKVEKVGSNWPFVDKYTGWDRKGSLVQTGVVYGGKGASVRNSGKNYDPKGQNPGGAPYGYWGKSADYFQIEKINVTGNSNLILQFYAQHQSAYSGSPVFSSITAATLKVYAGFDGENWAELPISSDGVEGWSLVKSEFKIPEGQATIYLKFADFVGSDKHQFRIDDIAILAGGAGELINPGGTIPTPNPKLSVDVTAVNVVAAGGEQIINLTTTPTGLAWTATLVGGATVTPTINPATGAGNAAIKVSFPENSEEVSKTATVKLSADGASDVNVVFTQAKKEADPTPSPGAVNFPAIWDFTTASLDGGLIKATEGNKNATIGVWGAKNIVFKGEGSKRYPVAEGWKKDETAWEIKVPITNLATNSTINLKFQQKSSKAGPKDFVAEYSIDNGASWIVVEGLKSMDKSKDTKQDFDITIANSISSGNLLIRLKVSTDDRAEDTKPLVPSSGNNRLSGGKFSITLK